MNCRLLPLAFPVRVALSAAFAFTCLAGLACCQTPEERAAEQMDRQMKAQVKMMKQMEKTMEETEREMDRND